MLKRMAGLVLILGIISAAPAFASHDIVKFGEDIKIKSNQEVNSATAIGGSVTVHGSVKKDVVAVGDSVYLKNSSRVGGNVVSVGGAIEKAPGAVVKGNITEVSFPGIAAVTGASPKVLWAKAAIIFKVISFIAFLAVAALLVAFFSPQINAVSISIEKSLGKTLVYGFLVVLAFVPIIVLLAISIAGIVLIPVWILLVAIGALFGYVAAAQFVGRKIFKAFKVKSKSIMIEALSGVIILLLVSLIPLVGWIIKAVLCLEGLGAVALTRFGTQE